MTWRVRMSRRAERDRDAIYDWIQDNEGQPSVTLRWLDELQDSIASLSENPARCPLAPESVSGARAIRQLLFQSHRVLFVTEGEDVVILHIRHGSRREATPGELE